MPLTFSELTARCTADERDELAWFLAMHRARKTWETLRSKRDDQPMMELPAEGWKPNQ